MKIYVTKTAGFCFGVKRAINTANKCAEKTSGEIFTLGPIIHNPQVVDRLEDQNIFAKSGLDEIDSGTMIIRSHGVRVEEYEQAKEKNLDVVDATCPFVKKAQDYVSLLKDEGYAVIVVGEKEHPEVKGLVSYGGGDVRVVASAEELTGMPRKKKIGIVAQTTLAKKKLEEVVSFCLNKTSELKVYNTICNSTSIRQSESAELAEKVDVMIVVGGKNSGNTRRLVEICKAIQPATHHVELSSEIDSSWLEGAESVGVTSGASTPDWIIEGVVERIRSISSK